MTKNEKVNAILNILNKQSFADWYNDRGTFDRWVSGDYNSAKERDALDAQVRKDVAEMFAVVLG